MRYTYEYNGETYQIDLERNSDGTYSATIGEERYTFAVTTSMNGAQLLRFEDGRQVLAHSARDGEQRFIHISGASYTLTVPDTRRKRRGGGGSAGDLSAQMPGQVMDVLVADGEQVSAGQPLVVLEAMKMEIRVAAPADGVVKQVRVQKGDMVERGQLLVSFEAAGI